MSDFDAAETAGKEARAPATGASPPVYGPDDGLTAKQGRAVEALLREPTVARAAAVVNINERTLRRWIQEPVFRSVVLRARREAFSHTMGLTQKYAGVAIATLTKVMTDPAAAASARVAAAAVMLNHGRETEEFYDLSERVERLEEALHPSKSVVSRAIEPPKANQQDDEAGEQEEEP